MCTGIRLIADDASVVYGRTMEFGQETESEIVIIPRNYEYHATAPKNNRGFSWKTRYAAVGANMLQQPHLVDGLNECGLAGGLFYFPGYAQYQEVMQEQFLKTLAPWELLTMLLTTYASVAEVKKEIENVFVASVEFAGFQGVPEVHWVFHDASGASIVVEYCEGRRRICENPLGVCTNAPTFDWHMTNLKNYVKMFSVNAHPRILKHDVILQPLGQGSGMLGLPGDFTPPARFVRAVAYSQAANAGKNADEARDVAFHILNLFDIPRGVITDADAAKSTQVFEDYTQWTVVSDLKNKRYYWHTYNNSQKYCVDLFTADVDASKLKILPMEYAEKIVNIC